MCGFIAMLGSGLQSYDWQRANELLKHRGPDDRGDYSGRDSKVRFLFRRLSIIDLGGGHQPMANDSESIVVMLNGEIYNYRELRSELQSKGVRFRTDSDTEVLVHLFESDGPKMVERLQGMFAIAVWEERTESLHLFRDRFGIKPLYIAKANGRIGVASEIRPLLDMDGVSREFSTSGLAHYLTYGYTSGRDSIYRDVKKVPPATWVKITDSNLTETTYWDLTAEVDVNWSKASLLEEFDRSIELHLRSDVKLGAFLSGGFDSALVVARAAELGAELSTYTIRFNEAEIDESSIAEEIAQRYRTKHRTITATSADLLKQLPRLIPYLDEPLADSGILPNLFIASEAANDGCKVVLAGTGGDELFAGYPYHVRSPLERKVRGAEGVARLAGRLIGGATGNKLVRTGSFDSDPAAHYFGHTSVFPGGIDFMAEKTTEDSKLSWLRHYLGELHGDPRTARLYADLHTYVPDNLMYLFDRATMAVSIEGRVPFLHHPLVELALAVPPDDRTRAGERKGLLKDIAREFLPESVYRLPKTGFNSPVKRWMETGLREKAMRIIGSSESLSRPWWNRRAFERTVSGPLNFHQVWTLLQLELFSRGSAEELV